MTDERPEEYDWAYLCSRARPSFALAKIYLRDGWTIGEPFWTGEEWKIPACRRWRPAPVV